LRKHIRPSTRGKGGTPIPKALEPFLDALARLLAESVLRDVAEGRAKATNTGKRVSAFSKRRRKRTAAL
jgi:hypothetical protein